MTKGSMFYINWLLFHIYIKTIFKIERFFYKRFKNKSIKRRIFLSSGNISLINVLTIIKQLPEEDCEDILMIDTASGKKAFFDINLKAASMHNFKKIIINIHNGDNRPYFAFMRHNLFYVDEIYAHPKLDYIRFIQPMFPDCKYILFDEGIGSLIEIPHPNNKYISGAKFMNYTNKFDKLGWADLQIEHPNTESFKKIAKNLAENYPFDLEINKNSKTLVFCGSYWEQFNMGKDEFYNYQNSIMQRLIDNGFEVIYKPHPRDIVDSNLPKEVKITNCMLPLELYNIDVLAVISIASSISLQMYHYWHIAGFVAIDNNIINTKLNIQNIDIIHLILGEYVPSISELLKINANNYTKGELKIIVNKAMENKLALQPLLSENKEVKRTYNKYLAQEKIKYDK